MELIGALMNILGGMVVENNRVGSENGTRGIEKNECLQFLRVLLKGNREIE